MKSRLSYLLTVAFLFFLSGLTQNQAVTAASTPPAQRTLKVLGASYHYGQEFADVTEVVKSLLRTEVNFSANPSWLGVDPHPFMNKALDIFCEIDGKFSLVSLDENADVSRGIILDRARPVQATTDATVAPPDLAEADAESAYAADPVAFPTIEFPVTDQGSPTIQTIRINAHPEGTSGSFSGFRFRVDRTEAAARQHVADKTKMHLFWFFVTPRGMTSWFIEPVKGRMRGFSNFFPLKLGAFQNAGDLQPTSGRDLVIQKLAADRLQEGQEYIIWFSCNERAAVPTTMSIALGYRLDDRNFDDWQDLTDLAKYLGLVPSGEKVGVDQRAY